MIINIGKTCLDLRGGVIKYQVTMSDGFLVGIYGTYEEANAACDADGTDKITVIITGEVIGHKAN